MIIHSIKQHQGNTKSRSQLGRWLCQHRWLAVAGIAPILIGAALIMESLATVRGLPETSLASVDSTAETSLLRALRTTANRPTLHIDMKFKHYDTINAKRRDALRQGELYSVGKEDLVPAKIRFNGYTIPVKMRLKNGAIDHLKTDQWSYQVWVKDSERIFGVKHFSLQHVKSQTALHRWIWLQHLHHEAVPSLRSQFVNVVFNGTPKGTFVLEEDFAREFMASQEKPEGVIVKFDQHTDSHPLGRSELTQAQHSAAASYRDARILVKQAHHVNQQFVLLRQREAATQLLNAFQTEELPASKVFDVPLLAKFLALCNLWRLDHSLKWTDIHLYYNPTTARLEPIGFLGELNAMASHPASQASDQLPPEPHSEPWVQQALADPAFAAAYTQELHRITRPHYLEALRVELQGVLAILPPFLNSPSTLAFNPNSDLASVWQVLQERQTAIRRWLAREQGTLRAVQTAGETTGKGSESLTTQPDGVNPTLEQALRAPTIEQALARHPFLKRGEKPDELWLQPGEWTVQGDLILPAGIRLQAGRGVTLRFEADALFIARGPLVFVGAANEPIVLEPQASVWGGMLMLETGATSTWEQVLVKHTQGGVTFYQSPFVLSHSQITGSQAEDAIKVIQSSFEVRHSQVSGAMAGALDRGADAFDGESVEGVIESSQFVNVSGDAIDLSDAYVQIQDVSLENIGDKGLSIGQGSEVEATDIQAINLDVAAASLDQSQLRLNRISIENASEVGLTAYQKRLHWGPANILATQAQFSNTPHETQVQAGSWISLEGNRIESVD